MQLIEHDTLQRSEQALGIAVREHQRQLAPAWS